MNRGFIGRGWSRRTVQRAGWVMVLSGLALPWMLGRAGCVLFAATAEPGAVEPSER